MVKSSNSATLIAINHVLPDSCENRCLSSRSMLQYDIIQAAKLLFVIPYVLNPVRVSVSFIRALMQRGHEITLATSGGR